jgi:hypothetical protein
MGLDDDVGKEPHDRQGVRHDVRPARPRHGRGTDHDLPGRDRTAQIGPTRRPRPCALGAHHPPPRMDWTSAATLPAHAQCARTGLLTARHPALELSASRLKREEDPGHRPGSAGNSRLLPRKFSTSIPAVLRRGPTSAATRALRRLQDADLPWLLAIEWSRPTRPYPST